MSALTFRCSKSKLSLAKKPPQGAGGEVALATSVGTATAADPPPLGSSGSSSALGRPTLAPRQLRSALSDSDAIALERTWVAVASKDGSFRTNGAGPTFFDKPTPEVPRQEVSLSSPAARIPQVTSTASSTSGRESDSGRESGFFAKSRRTSIGDGVGDLTKSSSKHKSLANFEAPWSRVPTHTPPAAYTPAPVRPQS